MTLTLLLGPILLAAGWAIWTRRKRRRPPLPQQIPSTCDCAKSCNIDLANGGRCAPTDVQ